jgi:hypothetical protein
MAHAHIIHDAAVYNLLFCESEAELRAMFCPEITTLEKAQATLPSSVLPITGLRRGEDGILTEDARKMIVDGLKSRGIDLTNKTEKNKILIELVTLLCSVKKQYDFLIIYILNQYNIGKSISEDLIKNILGKNTLMSDIIIISRHIDQIKTYDGFTPFIEGWQSGSTATTVAADTSALSKKLARDREMLTSHSYEELRKHAVELTMEKNKVASNYLGIYGFLNLIAVGLIIYVAGTK